MKEILLSRGMVTQVDDEDYEKFCKIKWYTAPNGNSFYVRKNITVDGKQKVTYLHWYIMGRKWVDHADGNGLNNQKSNLRPCTRSQNGINRIKFVFGASIYKGVNWSKSRNRWVAQIRKDNKLISIGRFKIEIEAAKAYDKKALELFGEFAYLNFKNE